MQFLIVGIVLPMAAVFVGLLVYWTITASAAQRRDKEKRRAIKAANHQARTVGGGQRRVP